MSPQLLDNELTLDVDDMPVEYATFWQRVAATLVDSAVFLPLIALSFYNLFSMKMFAIDVLISLASIIYKPYLEWQYGATLGKMAVKIKVVNAQMNALTLEQSFVRFSFYFLSYVISIAVSYLMFNDPDFQSATTFLEIGDLQQYGPLSSLSQISSLLIMISVFFVAFDLKKQALHDKLAKTYVIKVPKEEDGIG